MGFLDLFKSKLDKELGYQKEILIKATIELARREDLEITDLRGYLCRKCYQKQAIRKSELAKIPKPNEIKCPRCGNLMVCVF